MFRSKTKVTGLSKAPGRSFLRPKSKPKTPKKTVSNVINTPPTEDEIDTINRMIDETSAKLKQVQSPPDENMVPSFQPDPRAFDGISSEDEDFKFLHNEISTEQHKAHELEEKFRLIQTEFDQEKVKLTQTIRELKQELHRTKPLHDNALFSLTRELRNSVQEMEQLIQEPTQNPSQPYDAPAPYPSPVKTIPKTVPEAKPLPPVTATMPQPIPVAEPIALTPVEKPKSKKKLAITTGLTIIILLIGSAILSLEITKKPKVDQKLVAEYLQKNSNGEVAGIETIATPTIKTGPDLNAKKLKEEISFEKTIWETLKEPIFGIQVQYPSNAVEILHTESNITFVRKDGYLFKIQKVETALSPADYWKQIKSTSLNFKDSPTKLLNREAVFLELDDVTDYPGNRYLVQEGKFIYDIWYATKGTNFSDDDIRRAKYMLDSLTLSPA